MRKTILLVATVLALSGLSAADVFTWTDTTSGVPGTVYMLETSAVGCTTSCTATLTITTSNVANAYIGWIGFHLDSGDAANLAGLTLNNWSVATGSGVKVPWGNNGATTYALPGTGGWSAIYANQLPGGNFTTNGLALSGGTYKTDFQFSFSGTGSLQSLVSMQVGYYVGSNTAFKTTQMSQSTMVPEPGGLWLVGAAMGMFGFCRRRLFALHRS